MEPDAMRVLAPIEACASTKAPISTTTEGCTLAREWTMPPPLSHFKCWPPSSPCTASASMATDTQQLQSMISTRITTAVLLPAETNFSKTWVASRCINPLNLQQCNMMQSAVIDGRTRASQPLWSALPNSNILNVASRRQVEPCQTLCSSCFKQSWGNISKTTPAANRLPKLSPLCNQGAESQCSHSWHLCEVGKRLREAKMRGCEEHTRGVRKAAERPQWHCSLLTSMQRNKSWAGRARKKEQTVTLL